MKIFDRFLAFGIAFFLALTVVNFNYYVHAQSGKQTNRKPNVQPAQSPTEGTITISTGAGFTTWSSSGTGLSVSSGGDILYRSGTGSLVWSEEKSDWVIPGENEAVTEVVDHKSGSFIVDGKTYIYEWNTKWNGYVVREVIGILPVNQ